jgi:hypothetical protein
MMTISPGDFWVAEIPFTDGSASQKRPVLVLWLDGQDAVVAAVTSAVPRTPTDVSLIDWRASGLRAFLRLCACHDWIAWNNSCCCFGWGTFRRPMPNV